MLEIKCIPVQTPFPADAANCYLIPGSEPTLIDLGPLAPGVLESIEQGLNDLGYALADIKQVLITHAHVDHCGIANRFVEASGAKLGIHENNVSFLTDYQDDWRRRAEYYVDFYRMAGATDSAIAGVRKRYAGVMTFAEGAPVHRVLHDGDKVWMGDLEWNVIHTPGHSSGAVCFHQPQTKTLIAGDHLLENITSNPILDPPQGDGMERPRSLVKYLESLAKIEKLDVDIIYPGHGQPFSSHRDIIRDRYEFHRQRKETIYAAARRNRGYYIYDLAVELFPELSAVQMPLALFEIVGHLDLLEAEGRIHYLPEDGGAVCICFTDDTKPLNKR